MRQIDEEKEIEMQKKAKEENVEESTKERRQFTLKKKYIIIM